MANNSSVFGDMTEGKDIRPSDHPTNVIVDFQRPDGSLWETAYNMADAMDLAIITKAIEDGYRVVAMRPATEADLARMFEG